MEAVNRIDAPGTAEADWLVSPSWAGLRCEPVSAWLPEASRLVVVAPHPDDEVLACGGLLALHAERGARCLLVAVTDGEASHRGVSLWPPERLAAVRRAERAEGLQRLGVPQHAIDGLVGLGLPDAAVADHQERLLRALCGLLQPGDVVVSTWRHDGHPDHEATGTAAALACATLGLRLLEAPVWMWHWATPGDRRVPWRRLRGLPLDGATCQRKQAALAAHASQLRPREGLGLAVLDANAVARAAREREAFFV